MRKHDPDRFLTALFSPAEKREALFTLYAFNHELARAREVAREPLMALVRLQWWREVVEGAARRHDVAGPVGEALAAGALLAADLEGMIAGREMEVDGGDWREWVLLTAGGVAVAAAHSLLSAPGNPHPGVLSKPGEEAVRCLGGAYGVAGLWRSGRPVEREQGLEWLRAGPVPREVRAAVLVAALARRDLARAVPVKERGIGDKLAVVRMSVSGGIGRG